MAKRKYRIVFTSSGWFKAQRFRDGRWHDLHRIAQTIEAAEKYCRDHAKAGSVVKELEFE